MPEPSGRSLVTNTTPLIALTAATGDLAVLRFLFARVVVPLEVAEELRVGGPKGFGVKVFSAAADWLEVQAQPVGLQPFLHNSLDKGEAAVIQTRVRRQGIWLSDQVVQFALSH